MTARRVGNPRGRPSLLKDPARAAILEAVRRGCAYTVAARAAGVGYSTLRGWLSAGRADEKAGRESPFLDFLADIEKARALFVNDALKLINRAGPKDWRA